MKLKKKSVFDAQVFLDSVGASRRLAEFAGKQAIFSQGDPADSVMYIQKGSVKFTVVNESGKEAVWRFLALVTFLEKEAWPARRCAWGRRQQSRRPRSLLLKKTK